MIDPEQSSDAADSGLATSPTQQPPRHFLFVLLAVGVTLLAIEAGSWILSRMLALTSPEEVTAKSTPGDEENFRQAAADQLNSYQALHPFLGFVLDPDQHPEAKRKTNEPEAIDFGFAYSRSPIFLPASEKRLVVAVLGGSVASILSFNGARALQEGLARIPRFQARKINIVSLAMGGFKQPQQLQTLAYLLSLGAHFDIVLNLDGFNEVALPPVENTTAGVFPFFPRKWHQRVQALDPELRQAIGRLTFLRRLRREKAAGLLASPWRHSPTARLLWTLADRRRQARIAEAELALAASKPGSDLSYQARGPRRDYASEGELYEDLAQHWQRSSRQMSFLSQAAGAEYYHVLQPNQYLEGSKPLSGEEKRDAWRPEHDYRQGVQLGYPLLMAKGQDLAAEGIAFLDASGAFRDHPETLYVDPCCHFNRLGNEILAREIVAFIAAQAGARISTGTP